MGRHTYPTDAVDDVLHFSGLGAAEQITGKSYKEDESTQWLGLALHMQNADAKRQILSSNGDTYFGMDTDDYLRVVCGAGFRVVYQEPFLAWDYDAKSKTRQETLHVLFRSPGQLLIFDTYCRHCNGGKVYYNWVQNRDCERACLTSSGSHEITDVECSERLRAMWLNAKTDDDDRRCNEYADSLRSAGKMAWCGDHDCREAILHNLNQLAANGRFVEPWVKPMRLWAIHHGDTRRDDGTEYKYGELNYGDITRKRLANLPEYVRLAIRFE